MYTDVKIFRLVLFIFYPLKISGFFSLTVVGNSRHAGSGVAALSAHYQDGGVLHNHLLVSSSNRAVVGEVPRFSESRTTTM